MKKLLLVFVVLLTFALSGCFGTDQNKTAVPEKPVVQPQSVVLYFPDRDMSKLVAVKREVNERTLKKAVDALVAGPVDGQSLFPKGTVCNDVKMEKDIAVIDFSAEFLRVRSQLGSGAQLMLAASLANTATEFDGVSAIRISVDGKMLRVLGNLDLTDPLGRDDELIKK